MERFFDDTNDPAVGEPVLTPVAYQTRLNKASMAIRDYLHAPDILGVQEMENLAVLQDLAARIGEDAIAAGQPDPQYAAYLEEGNDVGGIDVGYLVSTAEVGAGIPRVQVLGVTQEGKRSEEHTSELPSLMRISYAVFCLKKKNNRTQRINEH